jgi:tyrosinase
MKAAAFLGTALVAAAVHAGVLPRDTAAGNNDGLTPSEDLNDLIEQAKAQVINNVTETEQKLRKRGQTPRCTVGNLVFRRE